MWPIIRMRLNSKKCYSIQLYYKPNTRKLVMFLIGRPSVRYSIGTQALQKFILCCKSSPWILTVCQTSGHFKTSVSCVNFLNVSLESNFKHFSFFSQHIGNSLHRNGSSLHLQWSDCLTDSGKLAAHWCSWHKCCTWHCRLRYLAPLPWALALSIRSGA